MTSPLGAPGLTRLRVVAGSVVQSRYLEEAPRHRTTVPSTIGESSVRRNATKAC